ncbi:hypothetical protein Rruber_05682 (plasmid) [Rhodococcus ruber]
MSEGGDFFDGGRVAFFVGDALDQMAGPLPHSLVKSTERHGGDGVFCEVRLGAGQCGVAFGAAQPFGGECVVESSAAEGPLDAADGSGIVAELGEGGGLFDGQLASLHSVALLGVAQGQGRLDLGAGRLGATGDPGGGQSVVGQGLEQGQALAVGDRGAVFVLAPLGDEPFDGGVGAIAFVADDEGGDLGQSGLEGCGGAAVAGEHAQGSGGGAAHSDGGQNPLLCDRLAEGIGQAQVMADVGVGEQISGVDGGEFGGASVVHDSSLHLF